jgi:hypothetical protein
MLGGNRERERERERERFGKLSDPGRANYNIHRNTYIGDSSLNARNDGRQGKDTTTLYCINSNTYTSLRSQTSPSRAEITDQVRYDGKLIFHYPKEIGKYAYLINKYADPRTEYQYPTAKYEYPITEYKYRKAQYQYPITKYEYRNAKYHYPITKYAYRKVKYDSQKMLKRQPPAYIQCTFEQNLTQYGNNIPFCFTILYPYTMNRNCFAPTLGSDLYFYDGWQLIKNFVDDNLDDLVTIDDDWWEDTVTTADQTWEDAYTAWKDKENRTKLITANKNAARDALEPVASKTIDRLRADAFMTEARQRSINIFIEPHSSTPTPTTTKYPVVFVEPSIAKRITLSTSPNDEDTKVKPHGVSHVEIAWDDELDAPPKKVSELSKADLFTKHTFILNDFDEDQRGTAVYIAARYVMKAEQSGYGPWSPITFAIIP